MLSKHPQASGKAWSKVPEKKQTTLHGFDNLRKVKSQGLLKSAGECLSIILVPMIKTSIPFTLAVLSKAKKSFKKDQYFKIFDIVHTAGRKQGNCLVSRACHINNLI